MGRIARILIAVTGMAAIAAIGVAIIQLETGSDDSNSNLNPVSSTSHDTPSNSELTGVELIEITPSDMSKLESENITNEAIASYSDQRDSDQRALSPNEGAKDVTPHTINGEKGGHATKLPKQPPPRQKEPSQEQANLSEDNILNGVELYNIDTTYLPVRK